VARRDLDWTQEDYGDERMRVVTAIGGDWNRRWPAIETAR